jgi:hypothetical protein
VTVSFSSFFDSATFEHFFFPSLANVTIASFELLGFLEQFLPKSVPGLKDGIHV